MRGPTKRQLENAKERDFLDFMRERMSLQEQKNEQKEARDFTTRVVGDMLFMEALQEVLEGVFKQNPVKVPLYKAKGKRAQIERAVTLTLSDTHFQSLLDKNEVLSEYGPVQERRRLAKVVVETLEYKPHYRDNSVLNVHLLGDMIAGLSAHDPRAGAPLAQQFAVCVHLLVEAIAVLATGYRQVNVYCTPGNHGRNIARHKGLGVHQKWDAIETMIYTAVKGAVAHLRNVRVEIPLTPFFIYDSFGHRIMGTHGDTVINVGNVGSTLNIASINQAMSEFNDGLIHKKEQPVEVLYTGHVHWATRTPLPCGVTLIVNPALTPADPFAVSIGKIKPLTAATLSESVQGHPAGDYRLLEVNEATDNDATLDKVIKPFVKL